MNSLDELGQSKAQRTVANPLLVLLLKALWGGTKIGFKAGWLLVLGAFKTTFGLTKIMLAIVFCMTSM